MSPKKTSLTNGLKKEKKQKNLKEKTPKKIESPILSEAEEPKDKQPIDADLKDLIPEEEGEKPKRKYKRRKKKEPEVIQVASVMLLPVNFVLSHLATIYNEPAFKLNQIEQDEFSSALDKVASKYLPSWVESYNDELALAFISLTIFYPRWKLYKERKENEKTPNRHKEEDKTLETPE